MLIRKIVLQNFMSHTSSIVELPRLGIVLVTGPNGSGKSSLAEAVATGVWGKTLRGSSPWVDDSKGSVTVETDLEGKSFSFCRNASKKGKATATFDPAPTTYSTASKTQVAIDGIVGSFDIWRKCSVFSSQDASHFTLATDAERKRLLESLLGLDKFDTALKACRDAQKEIWAKIRELEYDLAGKETVKEFFEQSIAEKRAKLDGEKTKVETSGYTKEDRVRLKKLLSETIGEHKVVSNALGQCKDKGYRLRAREDELRKSLTLFENDICPTCEQSLKGDSFLKVKKERHTELEQISIEIQALKNTRTSLEVEDQHLGKRVLETRDKLEGQLEFQSLGHGPLISHLEHEIAEAEEGIKKASEERRELEKKLEEFQYDLALNANTQTVLGTKGVRAHILTSALSALELTSNKWLQKIAPKHARISIKPYVENKTGGTRDSISLEITGLGNGSGYKALSGGQRRRVDVALLLGLAELAQASSQHTKGTVFFDEVFDSLDEEGLSAVSSVIEEMSMDRTVVVISHSPDMADSLSPVKHIHIEEGIVTDL